MYLCVYKRKNENGDHKIHSGKVYFINLDKTSEFELVSINRQRSVGEKLLSHQNKYCTPPSKT